MYKFFHFLFPRNQPANFPFIDEPQVVNKLCRSYLTLRLPSYELWEVANNDHFPVVLMCMTNII